MTLPRNTRFMIALEKEIELVKKNINAFSMMIIKDNAKLKATEQQSEITRKEIIRFHASLQTKIPLKSDLTKARQLREDMASLEEDVILILDHISECEKKLIDANNKLMRYVNIATENKNVDDTLKKTYKQLSDYDTLLNDYIKNNPRSNNLTHMKNLRARVSAILTNQNSDRYDNIMKLGAIHELHIYLTKQLPLLHSKKYFSTLFSSSIDITQKCLNVLPQASYYEKHLKLLEDTAKLTFQR